jgi:hypothetical protein
MPYIRPPAGITPPAPGLDREEPTFVPEEDIPSSDSASAGRTERGPGAREERPLKSPERE